MSLKAGYKVTGYIVGEDNLFLYGMHIAFLVSFLLCFIAFLITGFRLFKKRKSK